MSEALRKAAEQALEALEVAQGVYQKTQDHPILVSAYKTLRAALAEPEPVPGAWTSMGQVTFTPPTIDPETYTAWYAAPPRREPLSDEQIERLTDGIAVDDYAHDLVRRVEQYHGIGGKE